MTINAGRLFIAALLACLLTSSGWAHAGPLIRLGSDDWCPFVCSTDGKPPSGYLVELTSMDGAGRVSGGTGAHAVQPGHHPNGASLP